MRDLKAIGAHNVTAGRARGLTGRARFRRMEAAYEPMRDEGRIPATYEVVYGAAWGTPATRRVRRRRRSAHLAQLRSGTQRES